MLHANRERFETPSLPSHEFDHTLLAHLAFHPLVLRSHRGGSLSRAGTPTGAFRTAPPTLRISSQRTACGSPSVLTACCTRCFRRGSSLTSGRRWRRPGQRGCHQLGWGSCRMSAWARGWRSDQRRRRVLGTLLLARTRVRLEEDACQGGGGTDGYNTANECRRRIISMRPVASVIVSAQRRMVLSAARCRCPAGTALALRPLDSED